MIKQLRHWKQWKNYPDIEKLRILTEELKSKLKTVNGGVNISDNWNQ